MSRLPRRLALAAIAAVVTGPALARADKPGPRPGDRGAGVRVSRLGTVPDQMLFDKDRIAVEAGKPAEVVFENNDLMPHNFVVTRPGSLEEVGVLAEETAAEPGALERNYVPRSPKVLFATRLLQPKDVQTLGFTAPREPGVYPFLCTYPGHWPRMFGAVYVVADIDGYLADPESYLARHPLPVADTLLKGNRPRKAWAFDDLAPAVGALKAGRSYANGKQMFRVASCASCHRLDGSGEGVGPDLAKRDPKTTPLDLLKNVLDPSLKVDDKYRATLFEMSSGKVVSGLVVGETDDTVKVVENPPAASAPVVLRKSEVVTRARSAGSIMPRGLLDTLTRDEVLDLMAYLIARGDAGHPVFHLGPRGHAHGAGR